MLLDKIRVSESTKTLRGLAQEGECTSVGAGSPWPVAMIGAAWGEKEKLHGQSKQINPEWKNKRNSVQSSDFSW